MCVLKCSVWSLKKASLGCDKLCWWPLNFSTLHNYTCIKIGKFIDPKSAWDITELLVHPSKPGHGRGSAPYGQSDSTSRPRAGPSWTVLNNAPVAKALSRTWRDSLGMNIYWLLTLVALLNISWIALVTSLPARALTWTLASTPTKPTI